MDIFPEAYAHKTGYKHNHGNGNNKVPEIDSGGMVSLVVILLCVWALFKYARKK